MLILFGFIAAIFIGISLGLIGGGGSILTVPVLVYLFKLDAVTATGYSLFIVGITSSIGSISYFKKGWVSLRTVFIFGIPSIISVFLTRSYFLPALPDVLIETPSFQLSKNLLLLLLFALLMMFASYSMIKKKAKIPEEHLIEEKQTFNYPLILLEGTIVGTLTGLVGAGGGFLIIPALVIFSKLPMKKAIGTSLVIISAKSLIGFSGELHQQAIDWLFLLEITALATFGILIGSYFSKWVKGKQLKATFGWFTLGMGIFIFVKEVFFS